VNERRDLAVAAHEMQLRVGLALHGQIDEADGHADVGIEPRQVMRDIVLRLGAEGELIDAPVRLLHEHAAGVDLDRADRRRALRRAILQREIRRRQRLVERADERTEVSAPSRPTISRVSGSSQLMISTGPNPTERLIGALSPSVSMSNEVIGIRDRAPDFVPPGPPQPPVMERTASLASRCLSDQSPSFQSDVAVRLENADSTSTLATVVEV
jgi:hypothetical protein